MRAVRFDQYGEPDVLYLADVERPVPAEGQLLVRVMATGANPFDAKLRQGQMQEMIKVSFPAPQGTDVAGVVETTGPGVKGFKAGDEILGASAGRGSQAQYALVSAERVVRKPPAMSWEVAGGLNTVGNTAYAMLAAVGLKAGDTVLICGAAGGVGSLASQLAVSAGATVIGVASERNHAWLTAHGVIPVAYGDGIQAAIVDAAPQGSVDAVLDTYGGGYVELGLELGAAPERIDTIADFAAAQKHPGVKTDGGSQAPIPQALAQLADQIADRRLELRIERVFELDEVADAYRLLEHGHPQGKVVLRP